jgi:hypothetical protein
MGDGDHDHDHDHDHDQDQDQCEETYSYNTDGYHLVVETLHPLGVVPESHW